MPFKQWKWWYKWLFEAGLYCLFLAIIFHWMYWRWRDVLIVVVVVTGISFITPRLLKDADYVEPPIF